MNSPILLTPNKYFILGYDSPEDIRNHQGYFLGSDVSIKAVRDLAQGLTSQYYKVAIKDIFGNSYSIRS